MIRRTILSRGELHMYKINIWGCTRLIEMETIYLDYMLGRLEHHILNRLLQACGNFDKRC